MLSVNRFNVMDCFLILMDDLDFCSSGDILLNYHQTSSPFIHNPHGLYSLLLLGLGTHLPFSASCHFQVYLFIYVPRL